MINLHIDFKSNQFSCSAEVNLEGVAESWTAFAKITGHPSIHELHVYYRLGDFLRPMFISETDLQFFSPLLTAIEEKATMLLPAKEPEAPTVF